MLACPRCANALQVVRYREAGAYRCPRCRGHAVTYPIIREAIGRGRWQRLWHDISDSEASPGASCPGCGKAMCEVTESGQTIDSCRTCYLLWFDGTELEALPQDPGASPLSASAREAEARLRVRVRGNESGAQHPPESGWQHICGFLGLPFELDAPAVPRAYATITLLVLLILVHGIALAVGIEKVWRAWGFIPAEMGRHGGATWVTTFFLHGGLLHLFGNCYFLAVFGDNVEHDLGAGRYLALILLGTLMGAAFHSLLDPASQAPLIGASGGISAVLLFYAARFPKARIGWALRFGILPIWWFRMTARTAFLIWLAFQFLLAWLQSMHATSVSAMGHLGGVGAGLLFVLFLRSRAPGDDYGQRGRGRY